MCRHGFTDVWNSPVKVNVNVFISVFKQRIIDRFVQRWYSDKESNGVLNLYNNCKLSFGYERYLDSMPFCLLHLLNRIRISVHSLRINSDRWIFKTKVTKKRTNLFML